MVEDGLVVFLINAVATLKRIVSVLFTNAKSLTLSQRETRASILPKNFTSLAFALAGDSFDLKFFLLNFLRLSRRPTWVPKPMVVNRIVGFLSYTFAKFERIKLGCWLVAQSSTLELIDAGACFLVKSFKESSAFFGPSCPLHLDCWCLRFNRQSEARVKLVDVESSFYCKSRSDNYRLKDCFFHLYYWWCWWLT